MANSRSVIAIFSRGKNRPVRGTSFATMERYRIVDWASYYIIFEVIDPKVFDVDSACETFLVFFTTSPSTQFEQGNSCPSTTLDIAIRNAWLEVCPSKVVLNFSF